MYLEGDVGDIYSLVKKKKLEQVLSIWPNLHLCCDRDGVLAGGSCVGAEHSKLVLMLAQA